MPLGWQRSASSSTPPGPLDLSAGLRVSTSSTTTVSSAPPSSLPTASTASFPSELPRQSLEADHVLVPLTFPSTPPDPTHLLLTIRHLCADRWIQLTVPKEMKMGALKRLAMVKCGIIQGDVAEVLDEKAVRGAGGSAGAGSSELSRTKSALGKAKQGLSFHKAMVSTSSHSLATMSSLPLLDTAIPHSSSLQALSNVCPHISGHTTPVPSQTRDVSALPSSPPSLSSASSSAGRHSRRSSVQDIDLSFIGQQQHLDALNELLVPHSEGSSAKGVGVKRGRSATEGRATIVKELERANELRMLKEARIEARYRLTNAVMGCYADDGAIVGRKCVQYDCLTLHNAPTFYDPPLAQYYQPYLKKAVFVFKRTTNALKGVKEALSNDRTRGKWALKILEVDNGVMRFYKDGVLAREFPLPASSISYNSSTSYRAPDKPGEAIASVMQFSFSDGRECAVRPLNDGDYKDLKRVLGDEGNDLLTETDDYEFRINAINLAFASRHKQLDSPRARPLRSNSRPRFSSLPSNLENRTIAISSSRFAPSSISPHTSPRSSKLHRSSSSPPTSPRSSSSPPTSPRSRHKSTASSSLAKTSRPPIVVEEESSQSPSIRFDSTQAEEEDEEELIELNNILRESANDDFGRTPVQSPGPGMRRYPSASPIVSGSWSSSLRTPTRAAPSGMTLLPSPEITMDRIGGGSGPRTPLVVDFANLEGERRGEEGEFVFGSVGRRPRTTPGGMVRAGDEEDKGW